ncbi:MAG TPA: GNAT family N-acetyltransferase [Stellaceae bacterium]|nr:GNAT family N-acetyltransferase [Stellaceae bacterium]
MSDAAAFRFTLRDSIPGDAEAIAAIYAHHVRFGLGTFEETPPSVDEIRLRREGILALGLPFLVATAGERIVGYAYAGPYRTRSAYRYTLEDSIYVATEAARRGVGRALLARLIERCDALGYRQMVAVVGDSDNQASIRLHVALGFERVGVQSAVGFKHGRWVDSILMQRTLGAGAATLPKAAESA